MASSPPSVRVALDASAILGRNRFARIAGAALHDDVALWSAWIIGELVRKRTEWVAPRVVRENCDVIETRRRLRASRDRISVVLGEISLAVSSVNFPTAPDRDVWWLRDTDDRPVMLTALAAEAEILVTDNSRDCPLGESRNGVLLLGSVSFLESVYQQVPDAREAITAYAQRQAK